MDVAWIERALGQGRGYLRRSNDARDLRTHARVRVIGAESRARGDCVLQERERSQDGYRNEGVPGRRGHSLLVETKPGRGTWIHGSHRAALAVEESGAGRHTGGTL